MMALHSSCLAAENGWRVIYWTGENTEAILRDRINGVWGVRDPDEWPYCMSDFTAMRWTTSIEFEHLIRKTVELLEGGEERVLIVFDSINRLAKYLAQGERGGGFFRCLERIVATCQQAAEESQGRLGFMAISEMNRAGGAVGLDVEYAAACILSMKRAPKKPDYVDFALVSRESKSDKLGRFYRDVARCRFVDEATHAEELEAEAARHGQLTLLEGGM